MRSANVIGLHPAEADQPCHLVEMLVCDPERMFRVDDLVQAADGVERRYWQTAYIEQFLDADSGQPLSVPPFKAPERDRYRLAFFFHYLDITKSLETSFGPVVLPQPSPPPPYLAFMRWLPP
jgi:hypothetical protein